MMQYGPFKHFCCSCRSHSSPRFVSSPRSSSWMSSSHSLTMTSLRRDRWSRTCLAAASGRPAGPVSRVKTDVKSDHCNSGGLWARHEGDRDPVLPGGGDHDQVPEDGERVDGELPCQQLHVVRQPHPLLHGGPETRACLRGLLFLLPVRNTICFLQLVICLY